MDTPTLTELAYYTGALIVAALATSRLTRLLTYDHMPVFQWLRDHWDRLTRGDDGMPNSWNLLMHCHYCASVWVAPVIVLSGYFCALHPIWWLFCGTLAVAYLAATYMSYDGDE